MTTGQFVPYGLKVASRAWPFRVAALAIALASSPAAYAQYGTDEGQGWACTSYSNNGGNGYGQAASRARAEQLALENCRRSGGSGCFVNCASDGGASYAATPKPAKKKPSAYVPRVFNNVPKRNLAPAPQGPVKQVGGIKGLTSLKPAAKPKPPASQAKKTPAAPKQAAKTPLRGQLKTVTPRDCNQDMKRLPTAKKITVNPCASNAARAQQKNYVPNTQGHHQEPPEQRYIKSLKGCKKLVNGVCIDQNRKNPPSRAGGPIYIPGQ